MVDNLNSNHKFQINNLNKTKWLPTAKLIRTTDNNNLSNNRTNKEISKTILNCPKIRTIIQKWEWEWVLIKTTKRDSLSMTKASNSKPANPLRDTQHLEKAQVHTITMRFSH